MARSRSWKLERFSHHRAVALAQRDKYAQNRSHTRHRAKCSGRWRCSELCAHRRESLWSLDFASLLRRTKAARCREYVARQGWQVFQKFVDTGFAGPRSIYCSPFPLILEPHAAELPQAADVPLSDCTTPPPHTASRLHRPLFQPEPNGFTKIASDRNWL